MKLIFLTVIFLLPFSVSGQDILEEYIRFGIENNLSLQREQADYEKSLEALREARGLFYPEITFNARYTMSEGGRIIEFPVGDLLNPVYNTLNSLTASAMFPTVENQYVNFLRPREHETKLRVIQHVFNTDIYYNNAIRKEMTLFEEEDMNQYKRELITAIKKGYYDVAIAEGVLSMLKDTRQLLTENIRVNKKLVENDKVTIDYLYRSETELYKFDQELQRAEKNRITACAYFNFLLNRSLTDTVIIVEPAHWPVLTDYTADYSQTALENREEIKKLDTYNRISEMQIKMSQYEKIPDMLLAVDYGFQGTEYRFNSDQDYLQASAILTWNIFSGFRNRSRIKQSVIEKDNIEIELEETRKQIELQVINIMNELHTAEKGIIAAEAQMENAREGFRLVRRKYEEGQATLLEYLDARTSMTEAEENLIISRYSYLSCFAEFEKVTAIDMQ